MKLLKPAANGALFFGWGALRVLSLRPRPLLERLQWDRDAVWLIYVIGAVVCGMRWGYDGWTFWKSSASFLGLMLVVSLIGDRCRRFALGYCVLSATLDLASLAFARSASDEDLIRVVLSAYELVGLIVLIVSAARLPRKQGAIQTSP